MFTDKDLKQFEAQNCSIAEIEKQIDSFKQGFPFLNVTAPATPQKGILQINSQQQNHYVTLYDKWNGTRLKLVPASGAATRMFKSLYEAMQKLDSGLPVDWSDKAMRLVNDFFEQLPRFAFYKRLAQALQAKGVDIDNLKDSEYKTVLHTLLDADGLNYGALPKGLLDFHKYDGEVHTAFEEHLVEAALYANDKNNVASLHFTVSPEHWKGFEGLYNNVCTMYQKQYAVTYKVSFSEQKKSTDTIAVDLENNPFRNADGSLLFRPAGHGALLENLNDLNADVIFIKNIDNVVHKRYIDDTVCWKKVLAGVLLEKQQIIFNYLHRLEGAVSDEQLREIANFVEETLCITPPKGLQHDALKQYLITKLNRPIRVCGMVKNEGEPGGGPFIACDADGSSSPQIAEAQQIDTNNAEQKTLLQAATHFNPVDLVCSPRNYKGEKFNLLQYRDPNTGFISIKSKDGKDLKAQELPGLWNGAMSNWNTIFVEVPLITFNPVKTVNDLLRKEHQ